MFDQKTLTEQDLNLLKEKYPNDYLEKVKEVKNGYPVQYLIGNVCFLNTLIEVNENVLIPRFETEYLVEKILKKLEDKKKEPLKVLDICTGSGCIAIALSKNTRFQCYGIDIEKKALEVAKRNNTSNQTNVIFKKVDVLKDDFSTDFDIIVSNPPYVAIGEKVDASTHFEPSIALYAEKEGLIFYETILKKIKKMPKLIAFEIGETQGKKIFDLAKSQFPMANISIETDLCGKERFLFIEPK